MAPGVIIENELVIPRCRKYDFYRFPETRARTGNELFCFEQAGVVHSELEPSSISNLHLSLIRRLINKLSITSVLTGALQSCHLRRQPFQTRSGRHH